jgi:hypothetical protein
VRAHSAHALHVQVGPPAKSSHEPQQGEPSGALDRDDLEQAVRRVGGGGDAKARAEQRRVHDEELREPQEPARAVDRDRHRDGLEASKRSEPGADPGCRVRRVRSLVLRAREGVEADADALECEVATVPGPGDDRVDRVRAAFDREARRGVELERKAEAARDVVGLPPRDQRELGLGPAGVRGRVQRAVTAQQHDAALGAGEHELELAEVGRDERLDPGAGGPEQPRGVGDELGMPAQPAGVAVRHQEQMRRERPQRARRASGRERCERRGGELWGSCRCHNQKVSISELNEHEGGTLSGVRFSPLLALGAGHYRVDERGRPQVTARASALVGRACPAPTRLSPPREPLRALRPSRPTGRSRVG